MLPFAAQRRLGQANATSCHSPPLPAVCQRILDRQEGQGASKRFKVATYLDARKEISRSVRGLQGETESRTVSGMRTAALRANARSPVASAMSAQIDR